MVETNIPYTIKVAMEVIFTYAKDCEHWIKIKTEILKFLSPIDRKHFSTAQAKKRQNLNEMEKEIIETWISWGGKRLRLPQDYE
jgi:hypothetical protein